MEDNENALRPAKSVTDVLEDLIKNPAFAKQRRDFEKIIKIIDVSSENERNLTLKCQQLQSKLSTSQLSEDRNTIHALRNELENELELGDRISPENGDREVLELRQGEQLLRRERQALQDELDEKGKRLESLEIENCQLKQEKTVLAALLEEKNEKMKQMESNNKPSKIRERIAEELGRIESRLCEMEKELTKKDKYIEELLNEDARKRDKIERMEAEIAELMNSNNRTSQNSDGVGDVDSLNDSGQAYAAEKCSCKRHKDLERNLLDMIARDRGFTAQLKQAKKRSREKNDLLLQVQSNNNALISELTEKTDLLAQIENANVVLKSELKENNNLVIKTQNENDLLRLELSEKYDLISRGCDESKCLHSALEEKTRQLKTLSVKSDRLSEKVDKSLRTIKELEIIRERYVSENGNLGEKLCELKKELAEYQHPRYPEIINSLKTEIVGWKNEIESMQNFKNLYEEKTKEMREINESIKNSTDNLEEAMQVINMVSETQQLTVTYVKTAKENVTDTYSLVEILSSKIKSRVEDLFEVFKKTTLEKRTLCDEMEHLKDSKMRESVLNQNGNFLEPSNTSEVKDVSQFGLDVMIDDPLSLKDCDFESGKSFTEVTKTAVSSEYETYISTLKTENLEEPSSEKEDGAYTSMNLLSDVVIYKGKIPSDASSDELESSLNSSFSETTIQSEKNGIRKNLGTKDKDVKHNSLQRRTVRLSHSAKDDSVSGSSTDVSGAESSVKSAKNKLKNILDKLTADEKYRSLSKKPSGVRNSLTIKAKEESSTDLSSLKSADEIRSRLRNQTIMENDTSLLRRMSKLQSSTKKETVSSLDLIQYRKQLRIKQKNLDLMASEFESTSSNFNVRKNIYGNNKEKSLPGRKQNLRKS